MPSPNNPGFSCTRAPTTNLRKLLVTNIAENMLVTTPMASVIANPVTSGVPSLFPNHHNMAQVISVETLLSRIATHARLNPASMPTLRLRPARSSSFSLSNIRTLASTAIPMDKMKPAMPESVRVTGSNLNVARTTSP